VKRILILDSDKHQYHVREQLNEMGSFLVDNANSVDDFRLKLYESDPDIILYYTGSKVSIHDIIELMLDTDYTNTPVLFFKDNDVNEFYNHNLLLGPFNKEEVSFSSIINTGFKYKEIFSKYKELENKITSLEENYDVKQKGFDSFSHFSAQVIQEFKKAKRFSHPLSLVIIKIDSEEHLKNEYPEDIFNKFMKSIVSSIKNSIRDTDIPMSYDGNNVLVLMPLTDEDGVTLAINRLKTNIEKTIYKDNGLEIKTKATIGSATMSDETSKFSEMVKKAMVTLN
jgi:diguanylate cyclase (GGDEF)-like protein